MKVLFFAQIREVLDTESLDVGEPVANVAQLRSLLRAKGPMWEEFLASERSLVAVNQTISDDNATLTSNDEVAFFPPVTGG